MLLISPLLFSLPIAICNTLHAHVLHTNIEKKICMVQYTHRVLIGLLISFYILPLVVSFFLHAKLIYFIRSRHNQNYLTRTAYVLPMKRYTTTMKTEPKQLSNEENQNQGQQSTLQSTNSSRRHLVTVNTDTNAPMTTALTAVQLVRLNLNRNTSSCSSQSSRSSVVMNSATTTPPIVLYKVNSEANANANRTVLLLVLLLSFYVFCWAPYNIYTWHHAYQLTRSTTSLHLKFDNMSSSDDFNRTVTTLLANDLHDDLRRIIFVNYSLYLLSMVSMCFSFIFYFLLNKQARHEFSRFVRCLCPWIIYVPSKEQRQQFIKYEQNRSRRSNGGRGDRNQLPYRPARINRTQSPLNNDRFNYINTPNNRNNVAAKRTVVNYGCRVQCCA